MKKIHIICSVVIINFFQLNAQALVSTENQWNVVIYPTFTPNFHSYSIRLLGDTLVNGINYLKIYYSYDSLNTQWKYQYGLLRQDSVGKVYYKNSSSNELMLYDFGLQVNDTFHVNEFCTLIVTDIDTITLNDGQLRKRIQLEKKDQPNWGNEYWINGIGSEFGLISHFRFCGTDYSDVLLCFYTNGKLLYPVAPASCFITNNRDIYNDPNIYIYPNPFKSNIEINITNTGPTYYKLINFTGTPILKGVLYNKISMLDLEDIQCGIYFLYLEDEIGLKSIHKVIKQ